MTKTIIVNNCYDCPLSRMKCQPIKEGGKIYCHHSKNKSPKYVGTFKMVIKRNYIARWCPIE